jgi:hypothetical protein
MKKNLFSLTPAAFSVAGANVSYVVVGAGGLVGVGGREVAIPVLQIQDKSGKGDVKSRIEDRMKRVKSAHHARSAKLSQAWSLTQEALAV